MSSQSFIDVNLLENEKAQNEIPLDDGNSPIAPSPSPALIINNPLENSPVQSLDVSNPPTTISTASLGSVNSKMYEYNDKGTLNEPVIDTLKRDLLRIGRKMYSVLNPFSDTQNRPMLLMQWDLWGPLVFTILLSLTLSIVSQTINGQMFVLVFVIVWAGSFLIYLNGNLLGAKLGMFHIMCMVGYCMVPLNFCSIIFALGTFHEILRLLIVGFCCTWASYSSIGFVKSCVPEDKRLLMIYPVILEYLFLSGVILMTRAKPVKIN